MKTNHSRPNAALLSTQCKVANAPESILTSPHSLTSARKRSKAPKSKLVSEKANSTSTVHIRDGGSKKKKDLHPAGRHPYSGDHCTPLLNIGSTAAAARSVLACVAKKACVLATCAGSRHGRGQETTGQHNASPSPSPSPTRRSVGACGHAAGQCLLVRLRRGRPSSRLRQRPGLRRLASSSRRFPAVSVVAVQDCRCSAPHPFTRHACRMGVDEHLLSQIWESVERRL